MSIIKPSFYKQSDSRWQLKVGAGMYIGLKFIIYTGLNQEE